MNIIVDYGLGNLGSVSRGFARAGIDTKISRDLNEIKSADSLILPGVGAFRDAIKSLNDLELITPIKDFVQSGKYMIGICLGMQLLYEKSHEYGEYDGLGLIEGDVDFLDIDLKVPHMGWNDLTVKQDSPLTDGLDGQSVYFVHSYFTDVPEEYIDVTADYGIEVPAMIHKGNVYGAQFHPEKSGDLGLGILEKFVDTCKANT